MTKPYGQALLVLCAALWGAPCLAETFDRDYHKTFDVQPGARLQLDHGDGDVTFTPWEQDVVDITVVYRAEVKGVGASRRGEFEVEFSQSGDTIRVTGHEPSFAGVGLFSFRTHEYTYKVRAPAYVTLDLEGEDGSVTIEGWRAAIDATLEDGDLHLTDVEAERFDLELEDGDLVIRKLSGELEIEADDGGVDVQDCTSKRATVRTEDGDVEIRRCAGDFHVRSSDGDVHLDGIRAGTVSIETEDGDVVLVLAEATNLDLTVNTEDGGVEVTAPADLSAELEITTGDGQIRVDLPGAELDESRRRVSGRLGQGEGRVRISTDDGGVTLRSGG